MRELQNRVEENHRRYWHSIEDIYKFGIQPRRAVSEPSKDVVDFV